MYILLIFLLPITYESWSTKQRVSFTLHFISEVFFLNSPQMVYPSDGCVVVIGFCVFMSAFWVLSFIFYSAVGRGDLGSLDKQKKQPNFNPAAF
jgi:hypothetical protein